MTKVTRKLLSIILVKVTGYNLLGLVSFVL